MSSLRSIAVFSLLLSACAFDRTEHVQACRDDAGCAADARCYEGFCIPREAASPGCAQSSPIESCYDGEPADTVDVGSCKAGQRICADGTYSACLGQVLPEDEVCNGKDDDCDGAIDDITVASTCDSHLRGACSEGGLMCRDGIEFCQPARESQTESCNAIDDDCDGPTDELAMTACYPSQTAGCVRSPEGSWQCNGQCATGQASCAGTVERCSGATTPTDEQCTSGTMFAQDEDCDGAVDERCACNDGDSRECYAGPVGTRGQGVCAPGSQTCTGTAWGACTGQTLPSPETCRNAGSDDDCNGVEDDVRGLGSTCVASGASGECRNGTVACAGDSAPACVASDASPEVCDELDQDCDGDPTNGFDFNADKTCGTCEVQCSASQTCCGGACIDVAALQDDPRNCGACGQACGLGQYCCQGDCLSTSGMNMAACACTSPCGDRACCGSNCRDLDSDKNNCGACGRRCPANDTCVAGSCRR